MKRLLVIEDDYWLADMYRDILENDFKLSIQHSAQAAMDEIDNGYQPDVLLLDILLPGSDGLVFLQELRSHIDTAVIPVCICSGVSFSNEQLQAFQQFEPIIVLNKTNITPKRLLDICKKMLKQ